MPSFSPVKSRPTFEMSTTLFVASLLCLFLAEAFMIRGLWFRPPSILHQIRGFDLPFLIWTPAFGTLCFLQLIRRKMRGGHIDPAAASILSTGLALLLLVAYLLITRFAQIAFR